MKREHILIDRCISGSLTQDEWVELSALIGAENVIRIQQGDAQLRDRLMYVSINDATPTGSKITMDTIRQQTPAEKGVMKFLRKWGLLFGIVFLGAVIVAILPYIGQMLSVDAGSTSSFTELGPMQLGIGAVLLISLGVAAWLEFSDRF